MPSLKSLYRGLSFFLPDGGADHLYFVVTEATGGIVATVNVSSRPCASGHKFIVKAREHPSLGNDSYLRFREAKLANVRALIDALNANHARQTADASKGLIQRLMVALSECDAVRQEVRDAIDQDLA